MEFRRVHRVKLRQKIFDVLRLRSIITDTQNEALLDFRIIIICRRQEWKSVQTLTNSLLRTVFF